MRSLLKPLQHHARWVLPVIGLVSLIWPFVPLANVLPATLGAAALISMSVSLALAGRVPRLDRLLGGPDKAYGWHRHAGYVALVAIVGHWALASSVGEGLLPALADLGELAGLVTGVGVLALSAIAAMRIVPHHWWRASHWLMGPLFVISVFHTFFSASPLPVLSPPWLVLAGASLIGLWGWVRTLRGRNTADGARVTSVHRLADAIEIEATAERTLAQFVPGQFQMVTVPNLSDEAHPFSIAGGDARKRRFGVRVSGDWTADLFEQLKVGDTLILGAPEGRFHPRADACRKAQLWVAGGAGITPFLSVLSTMKPDAGAPITLVYSYRGEESAIGLDVLCAANTRLPQLNLVLIDSASVGRMSAVHVREALAGLPRQTDLCMCGPSGMKGTAETVYRDMRVDGKVWQEDFDFRAAWGLQDIVAAVGPVTRLISSAMRRGIRWGLIWLKRTIGRSGYFARVSSRMET